jgi:predicted metal-dependent peptidase
MTDDELDALNAEISAIINGKSLGVVLITLCEIIAALYEERENDEEKLAMLEILEGMMATINPHKTHLH